MTRDDVSLTVLYCSLCDDDVDPPSRALGGFWSCSPSRNMSGNHPPLTFPGSHRSRTRLIYSQTRISRRTLHALQNGALRLRQRPFLFIDAPDSRLADGHSHEHQGVQTVRSLWHTVRIARCNILTCELYYRGWLPKAD
jgi:hypothetical protein